MRPKRNYKDKVKESAKNAAKVKGASGEGNEKAGSLRRAAREKAALAKAAAKAKAARTPSTRVLSAPAFVAAFQKKSATTEEPAPRAPSPAVLKARIARERREAALANTPAQAATFSTLARSSGHHQGTSFEK
jgi:hypothetical protein